mmetsp:Transcript_2192/g.4783  ORF Transcript_2192/g.4783 Transcript_2192/m.4783 type:complete len:305 (-) Transcript_2192:682-1596(-)
MNPLEIVIAVIATIVLAVVVEEVVAVLLLLGILLASPLVDPGPEVDGIPPERDLQRSQERVHPREEALRLGCRGLDAGLAVVDHDPIGQVGRHDEVVLHDEGGLLGVHDEALDDLGAVDPLLAVQVGGRLVDEVDVGGRAQGEADGEALQLAPGQGLDPVVHDVVHVERLHDVADELGVHVALADALVQELSDGALELGRYLLGLVGDVEVWRAGLGGLVEHALLFESGLLVGLEQAGEHPHEGGLAGAVLTEEYDDLRVGELSLVHVQYELGRALGLGLGHGGVAVIPEHVILAQLAAGLGAF